MIFVTINSKDMEDMAFNWVVKNELDDDEDRWEDEGWGFYEELTFKDSDESIFSDVDETGIETIISSDNEYFDKFLEYALKRANAFFDSSGKEISHKDWISSVQSTSEFVISICECSAE